MTQSFKIRGHPATTSQTASHLEALLACGVLRIIPVPGAKPRNHGSPGFFFGNVPGSSFSFFFPQENNVNINIVLCHSCWLLFYGTPSFVCVSFPFGSFGSPGITDGGRVAMLHVLRVGIARKFARPQNDSTGEFHRWPGSKKSETS